MSLDSCLPVKKKNNNKTAATTWPQLQFRVENCKTLTNVTVNLFTVYDKQKRCNYSHT